MRAKVKTLQHNLKIVFEFHNLALKLSIMFLLKISRYTQSYRSYSSKLLQYSDYKEHSATTIRNNFLDYFIKDHDHKFIRSSPVTPFCDPTVPFVNAGMNQVQ